jgi:hypothetical protein
MLRHISMDHRVKPGGDAIGRDFVVVIASAAKQSRAACAQSWIASSLSLLAMTTSVPSAPA